jgi:predicted RNA binding protein YcfA (HicA-like mRNA interferase family)
MKSMSGKELAKLLEANGWNLLRVQGSHHIYGKVGSASRISVPIHRNQDLKIG